MIQYQLLLADVCFILSVTMSIAPCWCLFHSICYKVSCSILISVSCSVLFHSVCWSIIPCWCQCHSVCSCSCLFHSICNKVSCSLLCFISCCKLQSQLLPTFSMFNFFQLMSSLKSSSVHVKQYIYILVVTV